MSETTLKTGKDYILIVPKDIIESTGMLLIGTLQEITADGLYVIANRRIVEIASGSDIGISRAKEIARYVKSDKEQRKAMEKVSDIPGVIYMSKPICFIPVN